MPGVMQWSEKRILLDPVLLFGFVNEYLFDRDTEVPGYPEGKVKGRDIFSFFNSQDRLAVDADYLCKVLLGKVMHRPEYLDFIPHLSPSPRIYQHNRS